MRAQSIRGQIDGNIPSTRIGQWQDSSSLIHADHLSVTDMGQANMGNTNGGNVGDLPNRDGAGGIGGNIPPNVSPNDNPRGQQGNIGIPPNDNIDILPPNQDSQNTTNVLGNQYFNSIPLLLGSLFVLVLGTLFVKKYKSL